jgi:hypothetical protein
MSYQRRWGQLTTATESQQVTPLNSTITGKDNSLDIKREEHICKIQVLARILIAGIFMVTAQALCIFIYLVRTARNLICYDCPRLNVERMPKNYDASKTLQDLPIAKKGSFFYNVDPRLDNLKLVDRKSPPCRKLEADKFQVRIISSFSSKMNAHDTCNPFSVPAALSPDKERLDYRNSESSVANAPEDCSSGENVDTLQVAESDLFLNVTAATQTNSALIESYESRSRCSRYSGLVRVQQDDSIDGTEKEARDSSNTRRNTDLMPNDSREGNHGNSSASVETCASDGLIRDIFFLSSSPSNDLIFEDGHGLIFCDNEFPDIYPCISAVSLHSPFQGRIFEGDWLLSIDGVDVGGCSSIEIDSNLSAKRRSSSSTVVQLTVSSSVGGKASTTYNDQGVSEVADICDITSAFEI